VNAPTPVGTRRTRARTMYADLARAARRAASLHGPMGFERYHNDPVAFAIEVLGFEPWSRQVEVLNALARTDFVSVPAGRAVGKSRLDAAAALWFVCTRGAGSRVICTAPTYKQVQQILWEEIRTLHASAKVAIRGEVAKMASTGARTAEGAQILGLTAEKPEAFQGIRAREMLVIADEASGIEDEIFHVIDGNTAGGAKLLLTGNPTRARGYFRESFKSPRFTTIRIPSTESPNVVEGRNIVRGLATRDWLEERKREWGEDSPLYKIHVLGEVVEAQEGQLFTAEMIAAAESRWNETPATGRLVLAIDPAGASGDGDESAFSARRGKKVLKIHARRGLDEQGHLIEALGYLATFRGDSQERPLIVIDRDGYVGAKVYAHLAAYQSTHEDSFELYGVRSGERARRKPLVYDRVRDELWFNLVDAIRDGLTFPSDLKLSRELSEIKADVHISGRSKITPKDDLRALLGRSPDRADSLALCVWEPFDSGPPRVQRIAPVNVYDAPQEINAYELDGVGTNDPVYG
jgi:phage terminase large subunit